MKKSKKSKINNIEEKKLLLRQDKFFSKTLKFIDNELTFNRFRKKINSNNSNNKLFLKKFQKIIQKKGQIQRKVQNNNIIPIKKIDNNIKEEYNNTYNEENYHLNKISRLKRLSYLPQISPYIYNNNTSISIDYNKADEMGAKGFKSLCDNKSDSIKEILYAYNDYNYNNIRDYNTCVYFNNVNDKLKNIKTKEEINMRNENKKINNFDDGNEIKNIFDKNYIKKKKISKTNKLLKNKIERIKIQNKKVYKVLGEYKKKYFNNYNADNRIYKINYNSIEKHIPNIILDSKSQRIFPENYINKNKSTSYDNFKIKLFSDRLRNSKITSPSFKYLNLNSSLNSSKRDFRDKKINDSIYSLKNIFITKKNLSPINDMKINLSQNQNQEDIIISNSFNNLDDY